MQMLKRIKSILLYSVHNFGPLKTCTIYVSTFPENSFTPKCFGNLSLALSFLSSFLEIQIIPYFSFYRAARNAGPGGQMAGLHSYCPLYNP